MNDKSLYVHRVLALYRRLPGTLGRVLRDDRRVAADLHDRGIRLNLVQQAFVLATARRAFRTGHGTLEPIRALSYFLPVIAEILAAAPDPIYLRHLTDRLRRDRIYPSD